MKTKITSLILGAVLLGTVPAAADTTFDVTGAFTSGTFNPGSTITIDTSTGLVTAAALSLDVLTAFDWTIGYTNLPDTNTPTEYFWGAPTTITVTGSGVPFPLCFPDCWLDLQNTSGMGFQGFTGGDITGGYFVYGHFVSGYVPSDNISGAILLTPESCDTIASVCVSATPLPAALPLFATGIGMVGLLGWRRKRKNAAAIAVA